MQFESIFSKHAEYYFRGMISRSSFGATADKLLYSSFKQRRFLLGPEVFHALMCASQLSEVFSREELSKLHRELQNYLKEYK